MEKHVRTYPPPLDDPHIIRHNLIRIDIKFPFFNPGAGLASRLLTVIVVGFGVGVVNVAPATLRRCVCLESGLSRRHLVELVEARDKLFWVIKSAVCKAV